mmetsp:Transcript_11175/g.18305  ORF Transcript_11175/g.18305 Transcript_11175/m.18305 type:complete len:1128 (+) Transcript_11175:120-3503(+)|eukprot:CAMPEP_0174984210 /NCGR_PEP_ID=MMETSP0004_2-20121128/17595_1 /TAXON_ID=420556 /ORGANISM="Ochromonas sp., Strain CCMP1393" /LENGTH=1127 /DNA_ID=CAMNT_0016236593 /DNA_START=65 /DNA_END=3448 /DNA_ORIENTATION=+
MASKGKDDSHMEEYNTLDQECKQLQHDLTDTVNLNDELSKVIVSKDEEIFIKEQRLESLKERNGVDGEQLEMELTTLQEKFDFEIKTKEEVVRKLELQFKRFSEIETENEELRDSIKELEDLMIINREEHANKMHDTNLEMKHLREDMERKMRDQLNKMDISYQKEAFAALSDRHKKAMFQNAKLKDEVALQGVGLNNLGSRLAKQNQQYEVCLRQLHSLNTKSRLLKEKLGEIAGKKITITRKKCEAIEDQEYLINMKNELMKKYNTPPMFDECVAEREKLHLDILNTQCNILMWSQRKAKLLDLYREIKPVYANEQMGRYNPNTFPLEASHSLNNLMGKYRIHSDAQNLASTFSYESNHSHSSSHDVQHSGADNNHHKEEEATAAAAAPAVVSSSVAVAVAAHSANKDNTEDHKPIIASMSRGIDTGIKPESSIGTPTTAAATAKKANKETISTWQGTTASAASDLGHRMNHDEDANSIHSAHSIVSIAIKPAEIVDLMNKDPSLATALKVLRGKESTILTAPPEDAPRIEPGTDLRTLPAGRDQNMIAWITLQIVDLWEITRLEAERVRDEKHALLDNILDVIHAEENTANFGAQLSKKIFGHLPKAQQKELSKSNVEVPTKSSQDHNDKMNQSASIDAGTNKRVGIADIEEASKPPELTSEGEEGEQVGFAYDNDEKPASAEVPPVTPTTVAPLNLGQLQPKGSFERLLPLSLQHMSAADAKRQEERDMIEFAELDEEKLQQLWDEAFKVDIDTALLDSHASHEQQELQWRKATSWLKPVQPARRVPVSDIHILDLTPPASIKDEVVGGVLNKNNILKKSTTTLNSLDSTSIAGITGSHGSISASGNGKDHDDDDDDEDAFGFDNDEVLGVQRPDEHAPLLAGSMKIAARSTRILKEANKHKFEKLIGEKLIADRNVAPPTILQSESPTRDSHHRNGGHGKDKRTITLPVIGTANGTANGTGTGTGAGTASGTRAPARGSHHSKPGTAVGGIILRKRPSTQELEDEEKSGLSLSDAGIVLADPLMGKKFAHGRQLAIKEAKRKAALHNTTSSRNSANRDSPLPVPAGGSDPASTAAGGGINNNNAHHHQQTIIKKSKSSSAAVGLGGLKKHMAKSVSGSQIQR